MMGILEDINAQFFANSTLGKNAREDQLAQEGRLRQQQQQAQIEALLNQAGTVPASSSMERANALTGGGQLPQAPGIDPVMMARMANIAGNPAMFNTAGQMANSEFTNRNMSQYQAGTLAETARSNRMQEQTQRMQAQAAIDQNNAAKQLLINKQQFPFQYLAPETQAKIYQERLTLQNASNALSDISDFIDKSGSGGAGFQKLSGQMSTLQDTYKASLFPVVFKMFKPAGDAPNEMEAKMINDFIGDVTSLGRSSTKQARIKMLQSFVDQQSMPHQAVYGMPPIQAQPDQSPFRKAYPSGATGKESQLKGVRPFPLAMGG